MDACDAVCARNHGKRERVWQCAVEDRGEIRQDVGSENTNDYCAGDDGGDRERGEFQGLREG